VALFIFHGASRDSQAGVAPKLSPLVAAITQLLKRWVPASASCPAAVAPAAQPDAVVEADSDDDADGASTAHPKHACAAEGAGVAR
jgi:hypothetical protein